MSSVPDRESDREFLARLDWMDATLKARLAATYPTYEPSAADLAEMAAWSQSVEEHDDALHLWLTFFPEAEKSTYYVS